VRVPREMVVSCEGAKGAREGAKGDGREGAEGTR
jgi:hypothetical protein